MKNIPSYFKQLLSFLDSNPSIHFLCLVLLSIVAAKLIDFIFTSFLYKWAKKTRSDIDDKIISILHKPIYYSLLFIGLRISISIENLDFTNNTIFIASSVLKTFAIFIWGLALFKTFILIIDWYSAKDRDQRKINLKLLPLFDNLGKIIIFLTGTYFIMISWGINPVGWLASAGVLGIVLGLAAKDTLSNLFSGIFIMMDSPYKEGDYINLDSGERGYVLNIGIRSTRIMTRDDIEITVPNAVIANAKIINESGGPHENERVRLSVGVAYGSDIKLVKKILIDIAKSCDLVSKDFDPRVRFRQFGDSSLNFELLFWVDKPEHRGRVTDSLNTEIYNQFNQHNIEIPFPQRTVHLKQ
tara:strand:- start:1095 stop:2162 length:1068 start_codon:yes stop_codon:yes gene_type:complete